MPNHFVRFLQSSAPINAPDTVVRECLMPQFSESNAFSKTRPDGLITSVEMFGKSEVDNFTVGDPTQRH